MFAIKEIIPAMCQEFYDLPQKNLVPDAVERFKRPLIKTLELMADELNLSLLESDEQGPITLLRSHVGRMLSDLHNCGIVSENLVTQPEQKKVLSIIWLRLLKTLKNHAEANRIFSPHSDCPHLKRHQQILEQAIPTLREVLREILRDEEVTSETMIEAITTTDLNEIVIKPCEILPDQKATDKTMIEAAAAADLNKIAKNPFVVAYPRYADSEFFCDFFASLSEREQELDYGFKKEQAERVKGNALYLSHTANPALQAANAIARKIAAESTPTSRLIRKIRSQLQAQVMREPRVLGRKTTLPFRATTSPLVDAFMAKIASLENKPDYKRQATYSRDGLFELIDMFSKNLKSPPTLFWLTTRPFKLAKTFKAFNAELVHPKKVIASNNSAAVAEPQKPNDLMSNCDSLLQDLFRHHSELKKFHPSAASMFMNFGDDIIKLMLNFSDGSLDHILVLLGVLNHIPTGSPLNKRVFDAVVSMCRMLSDESDVEKLDDKLHEFTASGNHKFKPVAKAYLKQLQQFLYPRMDNNDKKDGGLKKISDNLFQRLSAESQELRRELNQMSSWSTFVFFITGNNGRRKQMVTALEGMGDLTKDNIFVLISIVSEGLEKSRSIFDTTTNSYAYYLNLFIQQILRDDHLAQVISLPELLKIYVKLPHTLSAKGQVLEQLVKRMHELDSRSKLKLLLAMQESENATNRVNPAFKYVVLQAVNSISPNEKFGRLSVTEIINSHNNLIERRTRGVSGFVRSFRRSGKLEQAQVVRMKASDGRDLATIFDPQYPEELFRKLSIECEGETSDVFKRYRETMLMIDKSPKLKLFFKTFVTSLAPNVYASHIAAEKMNNNELAVSESQETIISFANRNVCLQNMQGLISTMKRSFKPHHSGRLVQSMMTSRTSVEAFLVLVAVKLCRHMQSTLQELPEDQIKFLARYITVKVTHTLPSLDSTNVNMVAHGYKSAVFEKQDLETNRRIQQAMLRDHNCASPTITTRDQTQYFAEDFLNTIVSTIEKRDAASRGEVGRQDTDFASCQSTPRVPPQRQTQRHHDNDDDDDDEDSYMRNDESDSTTLAH